MKRMCNVESRRKFIKRLLTGTVVVTAASVFKSVPVLYKNKNVIMTVDKDGNATLKGITITVDKNHNAAVRKG